MIHLQSCVLSLYFHAREDSFARELFSRAVKCESGNLARNFQCLIIVERVSLWFANVHLHCHLDPDCDSCDLIGVIDANLLIKSIVNPT